MKRFFFRDHVRVCIPWKLYQDILITNFRTCSCSSPLLQGWIIWDGLFTSYIKVNIPTIFRYFQNSRHIEVLGRFLTVPDVEYNMDIANQTLYILNFWLMLWLKCQGRFWLIFGSDDVIWRLLTLMFTGLVTYTYYLYTPSLIMISRLVLELSWIISRFCL